MIDKDCLVFTIAVRGRIRHVAVMRANEPPPEFKYRTVRRAFHKFGPRIVKAGLSRPVAESVCEQLRSEYGLAA